MQQLFLWIWFYWRGKSSYSTFSGIHLLKVIDCPQWPGWGKKFVCWKALLVAVVLGNSDHGRTQALHYRQREERMQKLKCTCLLILKIVLSSDPRISQPAYPGKSGLQSTLRDIWMPSNFKKNPGKGKAFFRNSWTLNLYPLENHLLILWLKTPD